MEDFLDMGEIIKSQTAELERLRQDVSWKHQIITACDMVISGYKAAADSAGFYFQQHVDGTFTLQQK